MEAVHWNSTSATAQGDFFTSTEPFSNCTTADSENDNPFVVLSSGARLACALYATCIVILGTVGNLLLILTILTTKSLRDEPLNVLFLNLALSHFGICIIAYPNFVATNFAGRWLFGYTGCQLHGATTFLLAMVVFNTLVAIAFYRFICMCKPHLKHQLTHRNTLVMVALCWLYAIIWFLCPFLGWSKYTYQPFGTVCSVAWSSTEAADIAFNACLIIFCYLLHLLALAYMYCRVFKACKHPYNKRQARNIQKQKRVLKICVTLVVCFVVCWTPYALMSLVSMLTTLPASSTVVPTMFAKLSDCLDPFVYVLLYPKMTRAVRHFVCRQEQYAEPEQPSRLLSSL